MVAEVLNSGSLTVQGFKEISKKEGGGAILDLVVPRVGKSEIMIKITKITDTFLKALIASQKELDLYVIYLMCFCF